MQWEYRDGVWNKSSMKDTMQNLGVLGLDRVIGRNGIDDTDTGKRKYFPHIYYSLR